jgi:hypothetical protein
MLDQPPVLGFAVEKMSEVHQGKEHHQLLMLIHEGMATMGASALGLYKAVKQGKEKVDIVGKGWHRHQGTSMEMSIFLTRGPDLPTMSSLSAFMHTPQLLVGYYHAPKEKLGEHSLGESLSTCRILSGIRKSGYSYRSYCLTYTGVWK